MAWTIIHLEGIQRPTLSPLMFGPGLNGAYPPTQLYRHAAHSKRTRSIPLHWQTHLCAWVHQIFRSLTTTPALAFHVSITGMVVPEYSLLLAGMHFRTCICAERAILRYNFT